MTAQDPTSPIVPQENLLETAQEPIKPQDETLEEEGTTEAEETEEEDGDSGEFDIFAPFQGLRQELIEKGVDMSAMDEVYKSGGTLSDADIEAIATHSGKYAKDDVAAVMNLAYKNRDLAVKAAKQDEQDAQTLLSEYNEAAGGDFEELKTYIGTEAGKDQALREKVEVWNLMLQQVDNKELQKRALREMDAFRASKNPLNNQPTANKQSDLGLLTKANTKPGTTQFSAPSKEQSKDPLEGNPLAGASVNTLSRIKMNPRDPQYEQALAVLKVKHPHLV